jgi:serine protease Do
MSFPLRNSAAQTEPGTTVPVKIIRNGAEQTLSVKLDERPNDQKLAMGTKGKPDQENSRKLGLSIQTLTSDLAKQLNLKDERGVLVTEVTPGSPADDAGIQRGDVIKEVDRTEVHSARDFQKATQGFASGSSIALLVKRGENTFFIALQLP